MTSDHHHIYMVGRYRQGQHTLVTLRSQGQSQGHQGHFRFLVDFTHFSISSYSFCGRMIKKHRNVPWDNTKNCRSRNFEFLPSRSDIRYRQGQHVILVSRSQGQGHKNFSRSNCFLLKNAKSCLKCMKKNFFFIFTW